MPSSTSTSSFFSSFAKLLSKALFTEKDANAQAGTGLYLVAVIDRAPDPSTAMLAKVLPRFKFLKYDGFKAKPTLLAMIRSLVCVGGASSHVALRSLVGYLVELLSKDDWAVRKAAKKALVVQANVERDSLLEFKDGCLKILENR